MSLAEEMIDQLVEAKGLSKEQTAKMKSAAKEHGGKPSKQGWVGFKDKKSGRDFSKKMQAQGYKTQVNDRGADVEVLVNPGT